MFPNLAVRCDPKFALLSIQFPSWHYFTCRNPLRWAGDEVIAISVMK